MVAHIFFSSPSISVPNLVGVSIADAARQISDRHLNIRILTEKEDDDLLPGTIINQKPSAHRKVKPYHAIYVIISKKPERKKTPNLLGKKMSTAAKNLEKESVAHKVFTVPSTQPKGIIIGQYPQPGNELKGPLKLYSSGHTKQHYIFPRLVGKPLEIVQEFLNNHEIPLTINAARNSYTDATLIKEQRPLPGSIISLEEPPHVQLLL